MCGIAGAVSFGREPATPEVLARMLDAIRHRGPDDEGTYLSPHVALGTRRLSIIDVAGGHQPLANEDGSVWVALNGEIFNYPSLRTQLEDRGHRFASHADTESIVHAYEEWGDSCIDRLNGQFAFALWDVHRQRLLLARDRVGIKPLHYSSRNGLLVFGSEIKAILAHPGVGRDLDPEALNEYLTYEHVPVPRTMFRQIAKLPPGHYLAMDRNSLEVKQYWDFRLGRPAGRPSANLAAWEHRFRSALEEAVTMELMSDVPLGIFLSGGLDSSTVAAFMATAMNQQVQSFSIAFEDPSFDESRYARQVADHLGLNHHEEVLTEQGMQNLVPHLADTLDEPLGDSSFVPCYLLARFARRHVTVALGGDGGDELLAGYSTLQAHRLASYYRLLPSPLRQRVIRPLVERLPVSHDNLSLDFKAKRFVAGAEAPVPERHHLWLGSFSTAEKQALLAPSVSREIEHDGFETARRHFDALGNVEELERVLYMDMKLYLDTDILTKVDRSSMASSLEARVPLLNQVMLETVAEMPLDLKLRGLTRKYLLKQVMKGILPPAIIDRPKKGFNMPVAKWFRGDLRGLLLQLLDPHRIRRQGLFQEPEVSRLVREHLDGVRDNRKLLWTLVVFQLWYDRWL